MQYENIAVDICSMSIQLRGHIQSECTEVRKYAVSEYSRKDIFSVRAQHGQIYAVLEYSSEDVSNVIEYSSEDMCSVKTAGMTYPE